MQAQEKPAGLVSRQKSGRGRCLSTTDMFVATEFSFQRIFSMKNIYGMAVSYVSELSGGEPKLSNTNMLLHIIYNRFNLCGSANQNELDRICSGLGQLVQKRRRNFKVCGAEIISNNHYDRLKKDFSLCGRLPGLERFFRHQWAQQQNCLNHWETPEVGSEVGKPGLCSCRILGGWIATQL